MNPIQDAVDRANSVRGRKPKYEAVDVDNPGFLTLRVRALNNDEIEGIYFQQSALFYTKLGVSEGKYKVHDVRDAELKRMAKAALVEPGHELRGPLVDAVHARGRGRGTAKKPRGAKRKVTK